MLRIFALTTLWFAASLYGDIVYLEDGSTQEGTVEVEKDRVIVTTESGERIVIPKSDVKRVKYESTSTPEELLEMLDEFESLIAPALGLVAPEQREFSEVTRGHSSSAQRETDVASARQGNANSQYQQSYSSTTRSSSYNSSTRWRTGLYTEEVTTDKFVDEWVRYAAQFRAIQKTQAFKRHTRPGKGDKSLAEYVHNMPRTDEAELIGPAIRDALESVKKTFKYAKAADGAMNTVRQREVDWDQRIRRAEISAMRTKNKAETARQRARADIDVEALRAQKENDLQERKLTADNAVNLVAAERIITIEMLRQLRSVLSELAERNIGKTAPDETSPQEAPKE